MGSYGDLKRQLAAEQRRRVRTSCPSGFWDELKFPSNETRIGDIRRNQTCCEFIYLIKSGSSTKAQELHISSLQKQARLPFNSPPAPLNCDQLEKAPGLSSVTSARLSYPRPARPRTRSKFDLGSGWNMKVLYLHSRTRLLPPLSLGLAKRYTNNKLLSPELCFPACDWLLRQR